MAQTNPVVTFTVSPRDPSTSDTVQLVDCSHDPGHVGIAWRAWDFGDGETSVGPSAVHRYARPGDYAIVLTLATYDGRVGRGSRTIAIRAGAPSGQKISGHQGASPVRNSASPRSAAPGVSSSAREERTRSPKPKPPR